MKPVNSLLEPIVCNIQRQILDRFKLLTRMYERVSDLVSAVKVLEIFWFWCQERQTCLGSGDQYCRHLVL